MAERSFATGAIAVALAVVACTDDGGNDSPAPTGGTPGLASGGAAGSPPNTGGIAPATGGVMVATGGVPAATGGAPPNACPDPDMDPSIEKLCTGNNDCCGSGRVCSVRLMPTTESYCAMPNAEGGPVAAACADGSDCRNTVCLSSSGECTAICVSDADCETQAPGFTCVEVNFGSGSVGMCARSCSLDANCTNPAHVCIPLGDRQVCRNPVGSDPPGTPCTQSSQCTHGVCIRQGEVQQCSNSCMTPTDCPPSLPECREIPAPPEGGQAYNLCFPPFPSSM